MALTIKMNDGGFNISSGINLAYVTTGTTGVYKFRYLVEATYHLENYTTPVSRTISFTQQQNQSGGAVFNLSEIYQSIVTPMIYKDRYENPPSSTIQGQYGSIHTLPALQGADPDAFIFSSGLMTDSNGREAFRGNANVMTLKFYEMYSTTADGIPVKQTAGTGSDEKTIFMMWGRGHENEGVIIDFDDYVFDGTSKKLLSSNYNLSGGKYQVNLGADDYHTIAFLNKCEINTSSSPYKIYINFRRYDGASIGNMTILNVANAGGKYDDTLDDERFFLFMGIGIPNLNKMDGSAEYTGNLPSDLVGITHYDVVVKNDATPSAEVSDTYRFNLVTPCEKYEVSRLAFMNRFGAWEYMNLNKEKTSELKVERNYVTKPLINQSIGLAQWIDEHINVAYPLDVAKQGKMTTSVKSEESFTLFTDNLEPSEIEQIKDMMMSPQIHLLDGENAKALILETANMKLKGDKNTGLYNYELKFKYASPKYRQTLS